MLKIQVPTLIWSCFLYQRGSKNPTKEAGGAKPSDVPWRDFTMHPVTYEEK